VALTFFTAPSVLIAINSDSPSGSQPEKLSVRSYPHPKLRGQLQFSDKAAQRDPAQRLKDLKARMQRKADREIAQAQPPSQPPMPFQKAVLQVAAFFSFGPGVRARPGSGALITPEGHLATNSHVIRSGGGFCAQPPVQGELAPLIVLLVTEDLQKPPVPRYVADLITDDLQLDVAVLKISRELKEGLNNLQELEEKVSAAGSRDAFLNQWAKEGLVRSIPIQPLILWDSDAALVGQRVTALGYPRPDDKLRNPSLNTDDRGNIQAKPEGFLRVGAAFAAPGSSGGAVVRSEEGREYLIGIICAGEFGTGQGVALARPINAAVDGPIKAAQLTINQAPVAHFIPKPLLPRPRETVVFDALERSRDRDGSIQECQWQIKENGQSLTLPGCRVERSFPPDSRPKVTLTVRDDKGLSDVFSQEILLKVEEGPCRVKLRGSDGQLKAEFDSIQAAINQAGPGDVIEVIPPTPPRACAESVEIKGKRELTLRGARSIDEALAFVLAGDGTKPTVLITDSENITLQGLTITQGNPGVRAENSRAIRLKQSILKANRAHGILWVSSSGRVSDDSRLEDTLADLQGLFGHGLTAEQKSVVDVIDTEVAENAGAGVTALGESELKLEFVQVRGNEGGLLIDGAKQVALRDVKVRANSKTGISAKKTTLIIVSSWIEDNREDGLSLTDVAAEIKENTAIARNSDGIEVRGTARLILQNSRISDNEDNGLFAWGSVQVSVTNSTISSNKGIGLFFQDSVQTMLANTQVFDNGGSGLSAGGDAVQVVLTNVQVLDNYSSGLDVWDSSTVSLTSSQVSGNGGSGVSVEDSAQLVLADSVISDNGDYCMVFGSDRICNGITVEWKAQVTIINSIIRNNTDWGVAVTLRKCGYSDFFTGKVILQGSNVVVNNNRSRKHPQPGNLCLADAPDAVIRPSGPLLVVQPQRLVFWFLSDGSPLLPQRLILTNLGSTPLSWTATTGIPGLQLKPTAGSLTTDQETELEVAVKPQELAAQSYEGRITIAASGAQRNPIVVAVALRQAKALRVPQDFSTIKEAVKAAEEGDVILIAPGTYRENLIIKKPLTLRGAGRERTRIYGAAGDEPVLIIEDNAQVALEALTVSGSEGDGIQIYDLSPVSLSNSVISGNKGDGLFVGDLAWVTLSNCQVSDNFYGLSIRGSARATIINSTFNNDTILMGVLSHAVISHTMMTGSRYVGILMEDASRAIISYSQISDNKQGGILMEDSAYLELHDSIIKDNKGPYSDTENIWMLDSTQATIVNSTISGSGDNGIEISDSAQVTLTNSTVSANKSHGLHVKDSAQVRLLNSTISGNKGSGIAISDQAQATIYNTTISDQHDDGTVEFPFAVGVSVRGSAKLELRDSVIKNNQDIGILLRESAEATMRDTTISANNTGISVWGSAQATIQENTIQGNKECGIWSSSDKPVRGGKNRMGDNLQGDLCGKVPPSLRIPLANQTDRIQLSVPQDYKTLQEAIDAIAPGGTITIAAGTHNVAGLTIYKDVTLQGAAEQQTIVKGGISICCKARQVQLEKLIVRESPVTGLLLSADEAMRVAISDSAISANRRHGIGVENSTQVTLQNSEISGNGHWGIYLYGSSQAMVSNTIVSRNGYDCAFLSNLGGWWGPPIWITVYICGGIEVGAKGQLELRDSTIKDNKVNGIELEQSAQATIFNTLISGNGEGGIIIDDQSQATINSTKISGNGGHGLVVGDSHVMISNTTIEGNGTSGWCNGRESFCNGIWAKSFSGVQVQLIVSDSIITNNKDWGMATWLKKCGYQDDFFAGSVIFQGRNKIEGNNKSGDQNGMGNPGNHPWNRPEVPDGQVCLP